MLVRMCSNPILLAESGRSSSRLTDKSIKSESAISSAQNLNVSETKTKSKISSPRTVLDELEAASQSTEDDTLSSGDSTITDLPSVTPSFRAKSNTRKQGFSPCTVIFSLLGSPFRKRNSAKGMRQPLLRCFSYEEIVNATNNFNPGECVLHRNSSISFLVKKKSYNDRG